MKAIATALAILSLALGGLSLFRVAPPRLIGATLGLGLRSPLAVAAGGAGTSSLATTCVESQFPITASSAE